MPQPKTPPTTIFFSKLALSSLLREGVGTLKIRTSKGQNVKSFFKDDQNVERSERLIFFDAIGNIRTSKVF